MQKEHSCEIIKLQIYSDESPEHYAVRPVSIETAPGDLCQRKQIIVLLLSLVQ